MRNKDMQAPEIWYCVGASVMCAADKWRKEANSLV